MRKYKKVPECPKQLAVLIVCVNWLNLETDGADFLRRRIHELRRKYIDRKRDPYRSNPEFWEELRRVFFDSTVFHYVTMGVSGPISAQTYLASSRLGELIEANFVLRVIATAYQRHEEFDRLNAGGGHVRTGDADRAVMARSFLYDTFEAERRQNRSTPRVEGYYQVDEFGNVVPELIGIASIMRENAVPHDRVRRCEACHRIFWAKRITSKGCRKLCTDIISQRRRLADPKIREQINEQRRENYATKNRIMKNKKSGNF